MQNADGSTEFNSPHTASRLETRTRYMFFHLLSVVAMSHCEEPLTSRFISYINIHEALCIDYLWLYVGVERAGYRVGPGAHISQLIRHS